MRYASRVDNNHKEIVEALRLAGASVVNLHFVGKSIPDILVGYMGVNYLMEIKGEKGQLSAGQLKWHREWPGGVDVVRSAKEAVELIRKDYF